MTGDINPRKPEGLRDLRLLSAATSELHVAFQSSLPIAAVHAAI